MSGSRVRDLAVLGAVVIAAALLRGVHLGAASLWWDEIVQIQTAALPGFTDVLWQVRRGDPPGLGNAGAVPLDYLLMHAWQRLVPAPSPERIEAYFRLPSWLFSTAAVGAVFLYARRFFGFVPALAAAALLATSVPHVLYAGEARFYSLFTFLTVLCLGAFSWVASEPRRALPWAVHALAGVATFLTGLLGILLLAGQYAVLAVLLLRGAATRQDARRRRTLPARFALFGSIAGLFLWVLWRYYRGTWIFVRLQHSDEGRGAWQAIAEVLGFFTLESPIVLVLFAASLVLVPLSVRGDRTRSAIVAHLTTSFLWIPVLAWLATWKGYYVRPRHALFLLPYLSLLVGIGIDLLLRRAAPAVSLLRLARPGPRALAALALVVGVQIVPLAGYLRDPLRYAALIKPTYDTRALAAHVAHRARDLPPDRLYLLVSDLGPGAYLRNPAIAWYLRRYDAYERVALRTTPVSAEALARLEALCGAAPEDCANRPAGRLARELGLGTSLQVRASLRKLLGIDLPPHLPRRRVGTIGILRGRGAPRRAGSPLHLRQTVAPGWALLESELPQAGP